MIGKYFIKMFRIKPIRNQTTAKYTYHDQNIFTQTNDHNLKTKLTSFKVQENQIINP